MKNGYPVFGVINDIFLNQQYSGFVNKVDYKIFFGAHNTLNNNLKIITSRLHLNINDKKFIDINKFKQIYSVSSSMMFFGFLNLIMFYIQDLKVLQDGILVLDKLF